MHCCWQLQARLVASAGYGGSCCPGHRRGADAYFGRPPWPSATWCTLTAVRWRPSSPGTPVSVSPSRTSGRAARGMTPLLITVPAAAGHWVSAGLLGLPRHRGGRVGLWPELKPDGFVPDGGQGRAPQPHAHTLVFGPGADRAVAASQLLVSHSTGGCCLSASLVPFRCAWLWAVRVVRAVLVGVVLWM